MKFLSANMAFCVSSAILAIGLIIDTLNFLLKKQLYYDSTGLFGYSKIIMDRRKHLQKIFVRFPYLFRYKPFYSIMLIRLVLSLLLVFFISHHWLVYFGLFIIQLIFNVRNIYSLSGADQMQTIILFGLVMFSFNLSNTISVLSLYFISMHVVFSYFFTGMHKMKAKKWRDGSALLLVLNSETFGNNIYSNLLFNNRKLARHLSWAIMLLQTTFFFVFILCPQLALYYLVVMFLFHLSISFLMNLNHFFWVFISAYPIVYYSSQHVWK